MPAHKKIIFSMVFFLLSGFAGAGSWPAWAGGEKNILSTAPLSLDRERLVRDYVSEFADGRLKVSYPKIHAALTHVLNSLPSDVFLKITRRSHPIIFVLSITSGIGRYANAVEFIMRESDAPAFQDGFYLVIVSDELESASVPEAIEGILYHEIAHCYLEHLRAKKFSCDMERQANREVKKWGFEKEYQKASEVFGSKHSGDSPCSQPEEDKSPGKNPA